MNEEFNDKKLVEKNLLTFLLLFLKEIVTF